VTWSAVDVNSLNMTKQLIVLVCAPYNNGKPQTEAELHVALYLQTLRIFESKF
jgi:hypothetical protein